MRNKIINQKKQVKYLGVILDQNLTFTEHVKNIAIKANKILNMLFPVYNRKSKLNYKNKLIIFKSIIRPTLTYACPAWNITSKSNLNTLQVVHNKCLRIVGQYPKYTHITKMHNDINIEKIEKFIRLRIFREIC